MAAAEHCPNCRLPLPTQAADAPPATRCPRCDFSLVSDASPSREGIQQGLSARLLPDRTTAEVPASIPRGPFICPECRRPVEEEWLFCPHCEAVLFDPSCNRRIILPLPLVPVLGVAGVILVGGVLVMIAGTSLVSRNWLLAAGAGCPVYLLPLLARPRVSQRVGLPRDFAEAMTAVGVCLAIVLTAFGILGLFFILPFMR
jgi:hypothetical protein